MIQFQWPIIDTLIYVPALLSSSSLVHFCPHHEDTTRNQTLYCSILPAGRQHSLSTIWSFESLTSRILEKLSVQTLRLALSVNISQY